MSRYPHNQPGYGAPDIPNLLLLSPYGAPPQPYGAPAQPYGSPAQPTEHPHPRPLTGHRIQKLNPQKTTTNPRPPLSVPLLNKTAAARISAVARGVRQPIRGAPAFDVPAVDGSEHGGMSPIRFEAGSSIIKKLQRLQRAMQSASLHCRLICAGKLVEMEEPIGFVLKRIESLPLALDPLCSGSGEIVSSGPDSSFGYRVFSSDLDFWASSAFFSLEFPEFL
ncbi:LOW QUALITY PROTEIN: hypothetical protein OSB04_019848 [Centaurea solstitialis]|uniref:Uncharacterized protein n=1 Tax=Centaurea solstitialis TaxID=347529 RepID=A0AA38SR39_9ASTR|nr:LOW QUALITY PROTEIN: hypothetical protein OSB04_019848 [Centaurea solstitialis]